MHRSIRLSATFAALATLAAGCGSKSKAPDHGAPSTVYPAPHTAMPQVQRNGGSVMTAPKFIAVTYNDDTNRSTWDDFTAKIGPSTYWTATTSEYGIGAGTAFAVDGVTPLAVHRADNAPTNTSSSAIDSDIAAQIDSGAYPPPDGNTLYLLFFPSTTTITDPQLGQACQGYGAYHTQTNSAAGNVAYAVIPTCTGQGPVIDVTTGSASHEMVEAATDPFGGGYYYASGSQNGVWDLASFGGELGDYCEYQPDAFPMADFGYVAQSTWSNAAAAAGHNPCEPWGGPFFAAAPVLKDTLSINFGGGGGSLQTYGVKMAVGSTKKIELDYFSDAPTTGTYTVSYLDLNHYYTGGAPEVTGTVDMPQGVNGQKAYLTLNRAHGGNFMQQNFGVNGSLGFIMARKDDFHMFFWPIWISQ